MLAQIEPIVQKDLVWVVDGGIAYDDFNNGIKLRAARVQLLDDYRAENARALHIELNGHGECELDAIISLLDEYQSTDAMPVVFHMRREDYEQLKGSEPNGTYLSFLGWPYCLTFSRA